MLNRTTRRSHLHMLAYRDDRLIGMLGRPGFTALMNLLIVSRREGPGGSAWLALREAARAGRRPDLDDTHPHSIPRIRTVAKQLTNAQKRSSSKRLLPKTDRPDIWRAQPERGLAILRCLRVPHLPAHHAAADGAGPDYRVDLRVRSHGRRLTGSVMLASTNAPVLGTVLLGAFQNGSYTDVAALSVIGTLVPGVIAIVVLMFSRTFFGSGAPGGRVACSTPCGREVRRTSNRQSAVRHTVCLYDMTASERQVDEVLRGAVDMHIHTSPDIFPRRVDAFAAAKAAQQAGMGAIVVKSHSTDTAARAEMAFDAVGFPVFGGVVLNNSVGGINVHAVRETIRQGGRVVSMPTLSAKYFIQHSRSVPMLAASIPAGTRGITIVHGERLTSDADRVLDMVAGSDLVLSSGHISPEETGILFTEAKARGIEKLLVTHPLVDFVDMSVPDMKAMASLGASLEATVLPPTEGREEKIRAVGAQHFLVSTDGGTTRHPAPVELLLGFAASLLDAGFTIAEVRRMTVDVPSSLLGLEATTSPTSPRARVSGP